MARFLAQMISLGAQLVGRAFTQALREEFRAASAAKRSAEEAGRDGVKSVKASAYTGMTLEEAKQILSVTDLNDMDRITKNYEHLFKSNDKSVGGSFYLQSKVVRAKERIEMELEKKISSEQEQSSETKQN